MRVLSARLIVAVPCPLSLSPVACRPYRLSLRSPLPTRYPMSLAHGLPRCCAVPSLLFPQLALPDWRCAW